MRELRDLTRRRKQVLSNACSERNRVQKVLEEANIKIGSVLTDVFGVSGQLILEALLLLQAIPSIRQDGAASILAEIGPSMAVSRRSAPEFLGRRVSRQQPDWR